MLRHLKTSNLGPAPTMELTFADRLNLLTGDNGLGKSFLLDIAWWALTNRWPGEVNSGLTSGGVIRPRGPGPSSIEFTLGKGTITSVYDRKTQNWSSRARMPAHPALVLYAMVDGSFAVWDPARNSWPTTNGNGTYERIPAYVFSPGEVWNGQRGNQATPVVVCNGLIMDWALWQNKKGTAFLRLCEALKALSPSHDELMEPGELTRIKIDDPRDIPTIKMPYGLSVPVVHAAAAIRRIVALAYLLVWSLEEHIHASTLLDQPPTASIVFLIDEIEAHLHPIWQRRIVPAMLEVVASISPYTQAVNFTTNADLDDRMRAQPHTAKVQLIASTHSPLVMSSVEPLFDPSIDAWFDLDYEGLGRSRNVTLTHRRFEPHGDATNWLTSEAFDLSSTRSLETEQLMEEASRLLQKTNVTKNAAKEMHARLVKALNPKDSFLFRWRAICEKRKLLPSSP